ncbi:MAG: hypothetical protein M1826_004346 [Phylliscum demangeonii]|nr:MAG: hypothetical protein M1826_004346 [Phylliscum demangeonii]
MALLTTVARLYTRGKVLRQIGIDDYYIILAVLIGISWMPLHQIYVNHVSRMVELERHQGMNDHSYPVLLEIAQALKWSYFSSILYTLELWAIKMSILTFYSRFVPPGRWRVATTCVSVFLTLSTLAIVIATIFQCRPVAAVWDVFIRTPTSCPVDEPTLQLATSACNLVTDLMVLVLPIRTVWKLQMDRKKKSERPPSRRVGRRLVRLGLIALFVLGMAGCILTVIRLVKAVEITNAVRGGHIEWPAWLSLVAEAIMWSEIEQNVFILCANLPALAALYKTARAATRASGSGSRPRPPSNYELGSHKHRVVTSSAVGQTTVSSSEEQIIPYDQDIVRSTKVVISVEPVPPGAKRPANVTQGYDAV